MTKTQALFVKFLRVRLECSWRKVLSHYYNRYILSLPFTDAEYRTNQQEGRFLCREAQTILNEDWKDEY